MAIKIETDENEFHELQHQWRLWKYDLQTLNLKIEFHLNHEIIKRQMLANLNASSTAGAEEQYFNSNASVNLTFYLANFYWLFFSYFYFFLIKLEIL